MGTINEATPIGDSVDQLTQEFTDIMQRTSYFLGLGEVLSSLKEDIAPIISQYRSDGNEFKDALLGGSLHSILNGVFSYLQDSTNHYGHEYRTIDGTKLNEIDGIALSGIGINQIMPLYDTSENTVPLVSVSLEDLDKLRLAELENVSAMAQGDTQKVNRVKAMITEFGGMKTARIFPDRKLVGDAGLEPATLSV